jgi:hypothetical protein
MVIEKKNPNFDMKNLFLILLMLNLLIITNSSFSKLIGKTVEEQADLNQRIKSIHSKIILDKEKGSCDLTVSEKVLFSFDRLTNTINHFIFLKRFSIYDLKARIINPDNMIDNNMIIETKFYSNTNVRKLLYNTISNSNPESLVQNFKENWVISIEIKNPIKKIEIEYTYKFQNGLYVDPLEKTNLVQFDYINPYLFTIENFRLDLEIYNYKALNKDNIKSFEDGSIENINDDKGIRITLLKKLPELSQYSVSLPLPFEIESCNKTFTYVVNIILYSITFLITILGLITCFKLSKD